jgi:hypothetical protein
MTTPEYSFFDTDMHLYRLSADPAVQKAASLEFNSCNLSAMSAFSMVELKGNYISCLILMRRKISDSESLNEAYSRIQNTGGRKVALMLTQLFLWLGGLEFPVNPWRKAQNYLLSLLDAQIMLIWDAFKKSVDDLFNDFDCTRAQEEPQIERGVWSARIPRCKESNTKCTIVKFMRYYDKQLVNLVQMLSGLNSDVKTKELERIQEVINKCLDKNAFPWKGNTCRKVGDLLIGLQSISGKELVSSNFKEHRQLQGPLGYTFREFPISQIRSK